MTRIAARALDWVVTALEPSRTRSGRPGSAWAPDSPLPPGVEEAAVVHGVEGWVLQRAAPLQLELPVVRQSFRAAVARHQRALSDLRTVAGALADAAVPFLVVKGPAVVATCHGGALLRSYLDLDVVVRPADLGAAVAALRPVGLAMVDANWPMLAREGVQELRLVSRHGGAVDLHWSLGYARPTDDRSPSVDTLMSRAVAVTLDGLTASTLDPVDTLVHLAVHAAESGGNRLVWAADLRAAVEAAGEPGLDALPARAREWQAGPAVQLMLHRTQRVLGLRLPDGLLDAVGGRGAWRRLAALSDGVFPPEQVLDAASPGRLLARAAVATQRGSLASAAHKSWRRLREGGGGPLSGEGFLFDRSDPRSPLHPVGGDAGAEDFFRAVASDAQAAGR